MNGRTGLLLGIMIAQLLIIGLLLLVNSNAQTDPELLLALDPAAVRVVKLETGSEAADESVEPVMLSRNDDGWLIGSRPADGEKVERLLQQLVALGPGWPVATTEEARERFAVTETGFQKKLTLELEDGSTTELLLGTSPGFKRLHARRPESDAIYSIALGDFDLPTKAADWLNKALLALDGPVLSASRRGVLEVARESATTEDWRVRTPDADAGSERAAAAENVQRWLERFETLRVVDGAAAPESDTPDEVFVFTTADGPLTYALYHDVEADRYTMTRSDVDGYFEVPSYIALQMGASLESLLPAEPVVADDAEPKPVPAQEGG